MKRLPAGRLAWLVQAAFIVAHRRASSRIVAIDGGARQSALPEGSELSPWL
jgi:acyl-CoA hydrolase